MLIPSQYLVNLNKVKSQESCVKGREPHDVEPCDTMLVSSTLRDFIIFMCYLKTFLDHNSTNSITFFIAHIMLVLFSAWFGGHSLII